MIRYLKGHFAEKSPTHVIMDVQGIGYMVHITLNTSSAIEKNEAGRLHTYLHVKEDSHTLYGFATIEERSIFVQLISVSGIGPNTARVLLSGMTAIEARSAIIGEHVEAFKKIKGIGPKTAKRIILDLKDKLLKDGGSTTIFASVKDNTLRDEALSALIALQFNKIKVQKVLNTILKEQSNVENVETLIKLALKRLS